MKLKLVLVLLATTFSFFCFGEPVIQSDYNKDNVQPVIVQKTDDNHLTITYTEPPETMWYSSGINYVVQGDTITVVIEKCFYNKKCNSMVPAERNDEKVWNITVTIPHHNEKVIMSYRDVEKQIYP